MEAIILGVFTHLGRNIIPVLNVHTFIFKYTYLGREAEWSLSFFGDLLEWGL